MLLSGRRGLVPLVVCWEPLPMSKAMLRLERVWGRWAVPPTMRVILHPVGRGEGSPVYPMGPIVCFIWIGGESIVPSLPLVMIGDSALKMGEAMPLTGEGGRMPLVLRLERVRGGRVVPMIVRFVLLPVGRGEEFPEDAVCLVGRYGRVPLVDSLRPLPKLVALFLLEPVGHRGSGHPGHPLGGLGELVLSVPALPLPCLSLPS